MPHPARSLSAAIRPADESPALVDWTRYRSIVIESDDWGACQGVRTAEEAAALRPMLAPLYGKAPALESTLESPEDLQRLYQTLESIRGCDGQPVVMTAFICLGNPDFAAIEADRFQRYHDIGIDEGLPPGWERGDLPGAWRDGVHRGVFAPEFHARLHHVSPIRWLERLRGEGPLSEAARLLFSHHAYISPTHLPEYDGMNARQQHEWVEPAIQRFERLFGFRPKAAVNSDATPMTEVVWAANGLEIFCLRNARSHDGDMIVYYTKPWNAQDVYSPMGTYDAALNMTSLSRNVHLDGLSPADWPEVGRTMSKVIQACWARNEPAILNSHRKNYVAFNPDQVEWGYRILTELLGTLARDHEVRFLSTAEVGQLYRDGYSVRQFGSTRVVRQWSRPSMTLRLPEPVRRVTSLPDGREQALRRENGFAVLDLKEGDYKVE